jgi:hypothetical protein
MPLPKSVFSRCRCHFVGQVLVTISARRADKIFFSATTHAGIWIVLYKVFKFALRIRFIAKKKRSEFASHKIYVCSLSLRLFGLFGTKIVEDKK